MGMTATRPVANRHGRLGAGARRVRDHDLCYVLPLDLMPPGKAS